MVTADYNSLEMMIFLLERGADMEAKNHVSYSKSIPLNKVKYLMFQHPSDYPSFMRSTPHTSAECFLDNECASPIDVATYLPTSVLDQIFQQENILE